MTAPAANIESARLKVILATLVINIVAVVAFSFCPWSDWRTGMALNLFDNFILIVFALRARDRLMEHLLLFGIVLGFMELPADAWLVDATKTLDYSIGGGPMLWRSPLWMPFAWEIVAVQFGYLGIRLWERFQFPGVLLTGLLGAVNIPFYEEMALRTRWWEYHNCRMILHTPYYIIFGELLIAMAIARCALRVRRERLATTVAAGVIGGAAIFVSYVVAYMLVK